MAIVTTLLGGLGLVATASSHPAHTARLEWWGGMLMVASLVGLGFNLAQASA